MFFSGSRFLEILTTIFSKLVSMECLSLLFQINGDIPPRLKKSAHEIILEFIRSRPPLNPVSSTDLQGKHALSENTRVCVFPK